MAGGNGVGFCYCQWRARWQGNVRCRRFPHSQVGAGICHLIFLSLYLSSFLATILPERASHTHVPHFLICTHTQPPGRHLHSTETAPTEPPILYKSVNCVHLKSYAGHPGSFPYRDHSPHSQTCSCLFPFHLPCWLVDRCVNSCTFYMLEVLTAFITSKYHSSW